MNFNINKTGQRYIKRSRENDIFEITGCYFFYSRKSKISGNAFLLSQNRFLAQKVPRLNEIIMARHQLLLGSAFIFWHPRDSLILFKIVIT